MASEDLRIAEPLRTVTVGAFDTAVLTRRGLADLMVNDCLSLRQDPANKRPKLVFSSNGQGIALAGRDPNFAQAMRQADIIHADGMSVVFASRLTSHPLPERISTTDFFHDAAHVAATHKLKFFLLGADEEQNAAATTIASEMYPSVEIVGRHHGYFGVDDDARICQLIRQSGAEVLWVALGKPRQEYWCVQNRDQLRGVAWIKTCGGLYSFLAGDAPRAPRWMQATGLEWLYRTLDDPKRLAWRYITTNPYAFYRLLKYTEHRR